VRQQFLDRLVIAGRCDHRRSKISLSRGIARAFTAKRIEGHSCGAAGEPTVAAKRKSNTRIRGKLYRRARYCINHTSNYAALPQENCGRCPNTDQRGRMFSSARKQKEPAGGDGLDPTSSLIGILLQQRAHHCGRSGSKGSLLGTARQYFPISETLLGFAGYAHLLPKTA
jgi:hypothetical protein